MKKFLIPTLIYLLFVFMYLGYSYIEKSHYLFQPVWDIGHYVDISESGYKVYPCTPGVEYPAGKICGNVGWYPLWPLLIKIIRPLVGGSSSVAYGVLAFVLAYFSFLLFYFFIARDYGWKPAVLSLAALALSPASFYLLTGFPYALLISLFLTYLMFLNRPPGLMRTVALFILAMAMSLSSAPRSQPATPTSSRSSTCPTARWPCPAGCARQRTIADECLGSGQA